MNFSNEDLFWIISVIVFVQVSKIIYHYYYLRKNKKRKLEFEKNRKRLK